MRPLPRALLWAVCSVGCVNEYHPEYHPVSIVSVNQTSPVIAVEHVAEAPIVPEPVIAPPLPSYNSRDGGVDPDYTALFARDAGDPFTVDTHTCCGGIPETRIGRGVSIGGNVRFYGNVTFNGDVYIDARRQ